MNSVMSKPRQLETPSDRCRVCGCNFKVKFGTASQPGKPGYISSENLFKPSKRKDTSGEILADTCRAVGVEVVENNKLFSDRVCNPCARKIRNLGTLYELVQSSIGNQAAACKTPPKQSIHASKWLLETPPGSSPCRKTVRVNSPALQKASRKSLQFAAEQSQQALKDRIESRLNIDHLPDDGGLQVKGVIVDSTGKPITRIPHEEESKQIVRQLCNKNWQAAANTILKHKKLKPEVVKALRKNVSEEVASYTKSESILLLNEPDEIASFSNTIFLEEVRVFCPVFYEFVVGASGQDGEMKKAGISTNGVAFAAAMLCRVRNPKASALHYRISTVLFQSGTKHEDLIRLNRLGVCMSPESMIRAQRKMGEQLEGKVKVWKKAIEENKAALLLCEEIEGKQIPAPDFDDMEIAVNLDLAEETLKNYDNFTHECFRLLTKTMDTAREKLCDASYTEECLSEASKNLRNTALPLYRYLVIQFISSSQTKI